MSIYNQTQKEVLEQLSTSMEGLSNEEVKKRQEQYGLNQMNQSKPKSPVLIFLEQYKDLLVIVLICAALISAFSGEYVSTRSEERRVGKGQKITGKLTKAFHTPCQSITQRANGRNIQ